MRNDIQGAPHGSGAFNVTRAHKYPDERFLRHHIADEYQILTIPIKYRSGRYQRMFEKERYAEIGFRFAHFFNLHDVAVV